MVCRFCGSFLYLLPFYLSGFEILMKMRTWLSDAVQHLVPNDNFHCQMASINDKFDLFGS